MPPQYISASRRCDLPRFHYRQFFDAWEKGEITYDGGFGRSYTVSLKTEDVCGYIFWSKDFSMFMQHPLFNKLIRKNNAVFHYTINFIPDLEPNLPSLEKRVETLDALCAMVGPERVFWRFDPVCKYVDKHGKTVTTDNEFYNILPYMQKAGIRRCYFSFMTAYAKLKRREALFSPFTSEERSLIANSMLEASQKAGITLYNCCNPEIPSTTPGIQQAHCVDDSILRETDRFGLHKDLAEKPTRPGCGCFESRDIGSYSPPCPHGCLYCYANPKIIPFQNEKRRPFTE